MEFVYRSLTWKMEIPQKISYLAKWITVLLTMFALEGPNVFGNRIYIHHQLLDTDFNFTVLFNRQFLLPQVPPVRLTEAVVTTQLIPTALVTSETTRPRTVANTCDNPTVMNALEGEITSPNYPGDYDNNSYCIWLLKAPASHVIYVTVHDFELEAGLPNGKHRRTKCPFDFLYMFESSPVDDNRLDERTVPHRSLDRRNWGTFCGTKVPRSGVTTTTGATLYLYFRTDATRQFRGFNITYEMIKVVDLQMRRAELAARRVADGNLKQKRIPDKGSLQMMAFGVTMVLFCAIGIAAVLRLFQIYSSSRDPAGSLMRGFGFGCADVDVTDVDSRPTPSLPTPPPPYGDVVKTEEDWNRVVRQLGEASVAALQRQRAAEELQVTYDLMEDDFVSVDLVSPTVPNYESAIGGGTMAQSQPNGATELPIIVGSSANNREQESSRRSSSRLRIYARRLLNIFRSPVKTGAIVTEAINSRPRNMIASSTTTSRTLLSPAAADRSLPTRLTLSRESAATSWESEGLQQPGLPQRQVRWLTDVNVREIFFALILALFITVTG